MPSTYSSNLRFELIGTGEQAGTWGTTTNTNLGTLVEQAIAGAVTVSMTDANLTLSTNNGASDQARNMHLILTSGVSLTATRTVTCPAVPKQYVVRNATTGGRSIVFSAGAGSVTIPNGRTITVVCDGTDVRLANDYLSVVDGSSVEQFRADTTGARLAGGYLSAQPTFRNRIINGDFRIWQRGTSQTTSGYGSDDRWSNGNVGSTKTHSRQAFTLGQTDVPGEPQFFSRTVVASVVGANNVVAKQHRIENVRTLAGQTATVSFWAKADTNRPIAIDFGHFFGTGGSPSAPVAGIGAQQFSLTSSWQRFTATVAIPSISGKTLGTNNNDYLELTFWFDAGSSFNSRTASLGQQSGTFDIALVQVEAGTVATAFEVRPESVELAMCQRYFHTTIGSTLGAVVLKVSSAASYAGSVPLIRPHPVLMHSGSAPSLTVYPTNARANPGNVTANTSSGSALSTSFTVTADSVSLALWNNAALVDVGDYFTAFVDVSAEL